MLLLSCSRDFISLSTDNGERTRENADLSLNKSGTKALKTCGLSDASELRQLTLSLCRASDVLVFCSVFTFNFYSPGPDYGLERTFGVEKTGTTEKKFIFLFIETPRKRGRCLLFSLFNSLFVFPKSFKTIAASITVIVTPPCRVCGESDPPEL